ncbi:MAG: hypothetical protein D6742_03220 [Cyanobacteria bacterium J069]|nr:MAG: hypothetical protein D6742_03220 [Cyanobacteria bacterium J069]
MFGSLILLGEPSLWEAFSCLNKTKRFLQSRAFAKWQDHYLRLFLEHLDFGSQKFFAEVLLGGARLGA